MTSKSLVTNTEVGCDGKERQHKAAGILLLQKRDLYTHRTMCTGQSTLPMSDRGYLNYSSKKVVLRKMCCYCIWYVVYTITNSKFSAATKYLHAYDRLSWQCTLTDSTTLTCSKLSPWHKALGGSTRYMYTQQPLLDT